MAYKIHHIDGFYEFAYCSLETSIRDFIQHKNIYRTNPSTDLHNTYTHIFKWLFLYGFMFVIGLLFMMPSINTLIILLFFFSFNNNWFSFSLMKFGLMKICETFTVGKFVSHFDHKNSVDNFLNIIYTDFNVPYLTWGLGNWDFFCRIQMFKDSYIVVVKSCPIKNR